MSLYVLVGGMVVSFFLLYDFFVIYCMTWLKALWICYFSSRSSFIIFCNFSSSFCWFSPIFHCVFGALNTHCDNDEIRFFYNESDKITTKTMTTTKNAFFIYYHWCKKKNIAQWLKSTGSNTQIQFATIHLMLS